MASDNGRPTEHNGPEPNRAWLWFVAILGVIVLFGIEYLRN
jgi:hypothetical protein